MASKYYELFNSGEVNESILEAKLGQLSFEEHYWHFACLARYYELQNQNDDEKAVLSKMCDMNYVYNAMCYYKKYDVLPNRFNQYVTPFENSMVEQRIEDRINYYNKQAKKQKNKRYWLNSLSSLASIPLMMFLMLVCKMESAPAIGITIVFLMLLQLFTNPMMDDSFLKKTFRKYFPSKKKQYVIPDKLNEYFKYLDRFVQLVNNELYLALTRAKDEKEIEQLVKSIKEKKPIL